MEPVYRYDQESDSLYISFALGEPGTGIELNDHMLLRINKGERRAVGLTFFDYSVLSQKTEVGPRSFPLSGLGQLSDELRDTVLEILRQPPVSEILSLAAYSPSTTETIPIASVQLDVLTSDRG